MKKLYIFSVLLILSCTCFSEVIPQDVEQEINNYLEALSTSNREAQLEALTKLDHFKTHYPDKKMKAFDNFMESNAMKETTKRWISNLTHESPWVRHSTLHAIVLMKSDFPHLDMSVFNKPLLKMTSNDPLNHIQVDAKIAHIYLNDLDMAGKIKLNKEMIIEGDVFTIIHLEMDKMFEQELADNI